MYAIVYPSALEFWRHCANPPTRYIKNGRIFKGNEKKPFDKEAVLEEVKSFDTPLSKPIHLCISTESKKWSDQDFVYHSWRNHFPEHSFIRLSDNLCISSPECCFLQAALHCELAELVLIANDLCAAYYLNENAIFGQDKRIPISNVSKIKSYLRTATSVYGIRKAGLAMRYARNNAYSPFESKIAVICVLPVFRGGFAIPMPELNLILHLSDNAAVYFGREYCCCDMVWEPQKVVFEYDSTMTHLDRNQHYYDKRKATALMHSGYKLISATAEQFSSFGNIEKLFLMLRTELGLRNRIDQFDRYKEQRWQVYKQLFRS